jgi:hypothetical protein
MTAFYGSIAAADAYHTERGNASWSGDDATKQAALIIASEWLDDQFGDAFTGYPTDKASQERAWPRREAHDVYGVFFAIDAIPSQIERATYEIALRQIVSPGSLFKDWTPGKEKLSVAVQGAVSVTYRGAATYSDAQIKIGKIASILKPILDVNARTSVYSGSAGRV